MLSAGRIKVVAEGSLRESTACYCERDRLDVDELLRMVCLSYVSGQASNGSDDLTRVQLTFHHDKNVMWIRNLRVASVSRLHGLGRQLVWAAERLARTVGICRINLMPLMPLSPARPFWEKLGYAPHPRMRKVLTKRLDT